MSSPQILRMAICLVPFSTSLDFIGPMDVLGLLVQQNIDGLNQAGFLSQKLDPAARIEPTYLAVSRDPVIVSAGPPVHADKTYDEEGHGQYDIIFIPGGKWRLRGRGGF
jgi:putative intracellular protease/amidase